MNAQPTAPRPAQRSLRPVIESRRIRLRPLTPDDGGAVYAAIDASRSEISRWMSWCHPNYSRVDSDQYLALQPAAWERGEEFALAIEDAATGELIGGTGINFIDWPNRRANLGYWIRTDRTGAGIAAEAVRLLAPAALADLELERIEIVAAIANVASQRVAEKAGARREAILRARLRTATGQHDAVIFSFTRADFELPALLD